MEKEEFPKVFTPTPLAPSPVTRVVMNWRFSPPHDDIVLPQSGLHWTTRSILLHLSITIKHRTCKKWIFCTLLSLPQHKSETERKTPTTITMHRQQTIAFRGLRFNEECEWVAVLARTKGTINWITEMCAIVVVGKGEHSSLTPQERNWAWVTAVSWRSRSTLESTIIKNTFFGKDALHKRRSHTLPHTSRLFPSRSLLIFLFLKIFNAEWRASSAPFAEVNNLLYDFFLLSLLARTIKGIFVVYFALGNSQWPSNFFYWFTCNRELVLRASEQCKWLIVWMCAGPRAPAAARQSIALHAKQFHDPRQKSIKQTPLCHRTQAPKKHESKLLSFFLFFKKKNCSRPYPT